MVDNEKLKQTLAKKLEQHRQAPQPIKRESAKKPTKQRRPYNQITPIEVARFQAETAITHNRTDAVRNLYPELQSPKDRAFRLASRANALAQGDAKGYVENRMTELVVEAIDRVGELIDSPNEVVAGTNARYLIDHVQGQAVKRSINRNENITLEALLNGS